MERSHSWHGGAINNATCVLVARKDLADAKLSAFGADEVDAAFDVANKKALEWAGEKRGLQKGVKKRHCLEWASQELIGAARNVMLVCLTLPRKHLLHMPPWDKILTMKEWGGRVVVPIMSRVTYFCYGQEGSRRRGTSHADSFRDASGSWCQLSGCFIRCREEKMHAHMYIY